MRSSGPDAVDDDELRDEMRHALAQARTALDAANARAIELERERDAAQAQLVWEADRLNVVIAELRLELGQPMSDASLLSAMVVECRTTPHDGRPIVEYKLELVTNSHGTLHVWHRHSTFRGLAATLRQRHAGLSLPDLSEKPTFGVGSRDRTRALNQFLHTITHAPELQWGIRVDAHTCVYKRRRPTLRSLAERPSVAPTIASSDDECSPRSSFVVPAIE
ncbi:hypothetical protein SDRG_09441 [Saprolegnia diclina VS20]|uniref:PX domain-containing protein n=1 Tax=Saprolegnia diclina (strain VS20) TaxID=1156394 RepID=T0QH00_SAPDV|nr:hypothetical protein SDRG_09441 [Saprolegnia diclina VS20]EQC32910.1 hypothetical protein SDRG_09441 [Saprolegnia diclina VS20]|eukprot:XP_008613596.1 hypothetical protein SDRG_09441 [Saprolegnia diclina VS20]